MSKERNNIFDLDFKIEDNKKKYSDKCFNKNDLFWVDILNKISVCKDKIGSFNQVFFESVGCVIFYDFNRLGI